MTKPTKLTEVCVNSCVRMGSTTFSPSQANLEAQRGWENKEQMFLMLPAMLSVAGPFFFPRELESEITSARKPYKLSLLMVLPVLAEGCQRPQTIHP